MEPWISETIETVLDQEGDFEIEYIIMNDGSKDNSASVAQEYADRVAAGIYPIRCSKITMEVITQENTGMYEAINRGFARATGDVYAWINADDLYQPGALAAMTDVFSNYPNAVWVKGITDTLHEDGTRTTGACRIYRQDWLAAGVYGMEAYFVEQDSVFWRADLWNKVAPMPAHYRSAADYWLWLHMAQHAPLLSLNAPISIFRKREGQISKGIAKYKKEQRDARPRRSLKAWSARLFFTPQSRLIPHFQNFFQKVYSLLYMSKPYTYLERTPTGIQQRHFITYKI